MNSGQKAKASYLLMFLIIICGLMMESCFYDEGSISFRSRKSRIANTWDYQRVYENGIIKTPSYFIDYCEFTKSGDATFVLTNSNVLTGSWDFNRHKDRILFELNTDTGKIYAEWSIELLTKNAFNAEETTRGSLFRYELRTR